MARIIAMLPTYNEAENIDALIDALMHVDAQMEVLVVDDDSPDGTWRIVRDRAERDARVHLLHRKHDRGRGLAGIAGFREALRLGADWVVEMDADWSHDPKWLPGMLARRGEADVIVASRLVPGGSEEGRPRFRRWITTVANTYIRLMLGLPVRDATSGYRLFNRTSLEAVPWEAMRARGPEVVQAVLLAIERRGFRIVEVPYTFVERRAGRSSFNSRIMLRSLTTMARLRLFPGDLVPRPYDRPVGLPLALSLPASWIYGVGRWVHRLWRLWGPVRPRRMQVPVICVGNLTVGGTGKTPFVQMLAKQLKATGRRPAIVSRGYRAAQRPRRPVLVSDGEELLASSEAVGDEARWLAEHSPGVPVVIHPERHKAGELACKMFDIDVMLLDDGFQHDGLRRDLDLVLWDVHDDPSRGRLLPAGRLREGLGALRRASAIILTHAEYLDPAHREQHVRGVMHQLKRYAPNVPIFEAETRVTNWRKLGTRMEIEPPEPDTTPASWPWSGRRVIAVSAIARPEGFEALLRQTGADVTYHFKYPDHHRHEDAEVARWRDRRLSDGAALILTTAKDAVKLAHLPLFGCPMMAVEIEMRIPESRRWHAFLEQHLPAFSKPPSRAVPKPFSRPGEFA